MKELRKYIMFEHKDKAHINSLGEFGLIEHLTKSFTITKKETKLTIVNYAKRVYGMASDTGYLSGNKPVIRN